MVPSPTSHPGCGQSTCRRLLLDLKLLHRQHTQGALVVVLNPSDYDETEIGKRVVAEITGADTISRKPGRREMTA